MFTDRNPDTGSDAAAATLWQNEMDEHRKTVEATAHSAAQSFCELLSVLADALRRGGTILLFGNGGSAADAQHLATELVVRYKKNRLAIPALALGADAATLTACANDLGYDTIFERQIEAVGRQGDVAFAISTSGRSQNILKGLRRAKDVGIDTVGLPGGIGGDMRELCNSLIVVPSKVTSRIQEMHITFGHMRCKGLEERLGFA